MSDFRLGTVGPVGDCAVLQVAGEVDAYTAPMLREQIRELAAKGAVHLVADLSRVDFLDSTGLGTLVGGLKRLREAGGTLTLVITASRILRLFQVTGLTTVLVIHPPWPKRSLRTPTGSTPPKPKPAPSPSGATSTACPDHPPRKALPVRTGRGRRCSARW
jgi:anti-sigma B factor antagonist